MKITILVGGRFHAFDLAYRLQKKGYLLNLITSYPKWKINKIINIDNKKIKTIILKEIIERILYKLKLNFFLSFLNFYLNKYFEYFASKKVNYKNTDILIGWSGFSYKTFQKSQNYNLIKILERGSTHIKFQSDILEEECKIFNVDFKINDKEIKQELKEYDLADYISIPSNFVKQSFLKNGINKKKLIVTPYGVNLNYFYPKKKKDNIFRFIYVGTLSIRKGLWYTLKAFNELNLPNAELILVGSIEASFLPLLKEFTSNKKIKILNHIGQNKLVEFYNISNVFVISSIEDGFAMVIPQALACCLPVICTENSGGSELIENGINGYVLPIRQLDKLKEKMLFLYEDNEHYFFLKSKLYLKRRSLSWDRYADSIINKYSKLLKNN
jgi:glycosyltransferase involved in cell wall biosynthesis